MSLTGKRILCVEDHADTCELLRFLLSDYQVTTVSTLAEALQVAQSEPVDLYLLDWWLPDGTGLELCQQIHAFAPHTPVLFCSANTREAAVPQALAAGARAYLSKPCDPEVLRQTVGQLLKGEAKSLSVAG
jgi:two-component system nitrate/nitrite response regulator NarL